MDTYTSELLSCEEWKLLQKAENGIKNNQNYVKINPRELLDILYALDQMRIRLKNSHEEYYK